jgi:sugar phosphate isomerase/epimerase
MRFGVSSFAGPLPEFGGHADSIELYIPKMNIYKGRTLQKDRLDAFFDEFFSYDMQATAHAPYFPDPEGEHPKELAIDTSAMEESDFRLMREAIDITAHAGGSVLVIHPGRISDNAPKKSFSRMVQNLKKIAKYAEDADVLIGLENKENTDPLNLCCEAKDLISAIRLTDSNHIGATLDIGHANLTCGGDQTKLAAFVTELAPYVIHVHVHDNFGKDKGNYGGDEHLAPGKGLIDYTVLKNLGDYDETYNLEVFSPAEFFEGKEHLKKIFETLK